MATDPTSPLREPAPEAISPAPAAGEPAPEATQAAHSGEHGPEATPPALAAGEPAPRDHEPGPNEPVAAAVGPLAPGERVPAGEGIDPATGKPAISGPSPEGTVVETQRLSWRDLPGLLKDTYDEWDRDNASTLAAALAYYLAFALAPTLVLIIAVLGFVVGNGAVKSAVLLRVTDLMGPQGAAFVAQLIESAQRPGNSIPATIVSVVTILVSATGIVAEIQRSMDLIWNVPPRPSLGVWWALKTRAQGLWLVLGGGLLLLGTMVASTILGAFEHRFAGLPGLRILAHVSELTLSFSFLTALFMLIYKLIPRVLIAWKDAFAGAMMTAFLFSVGKTLLAFYFAHSATASSYGAAGSFAVFLAWVYYSAQIFFFGAELAQVYGERLGRKLVPRPHPQAKAPPAEGLSGLDPQAKAPPAEGYSGLMVT